jgi:type I restriction enzyme S subunit
MIRPTDNLNPIYLERFLRSPSIQREIGKRARSSAQANLFQGPIRSLPIFVPPLDAQTRFARVTEDIRTNESRSVEHLAKLDELFASLQRRAFSGQF